MSHVPAYVKTFLQKIPAYWDDVKFLEGYPGKLYVVARRAGNKWYVAGINGENSQKELKLDLSFIKNKKGTIISTGSDNGEPSFNSKAFNVPSTGEMSIILKGNDGFVAVFE